MESMKKRGQILFPFFYTAISLFVALTLVYHPLGAESPLKKKYEDTSAHELQNAFNDIADLYKDSVVYISTEQIGRI